MCKKRNKNQTVSFFDKTLWGRFLMVLGVVSSIVTLLSFFVTASDLKFNTVRLACLFCVVVIFIFLFMWLRANKKNHANLKINNTIVNVVEGDIWALLEKEPEQRTEELSVIGVNDFYDVIVDNRIIASSSLHGQYITRINRSGKLEDLNSAIESDPILNKSGNYKVVPNRKEGKNRRYEIGSVVEFESYVLAAFTKFDANNEAWLSAEEYAGFWMRFWKNIDKIYAGRTINIPLMGAGITRFTQGKPSKQELLEVMLWTLKISGFHNTYSGRQINFLIYPLDAAEIDFYHIQHNPNFR